MDQRELVLATPNRMEELLVAENKALRQWIMVLVLGSELGGFGTLTSFLRSGWLVRDYACTDD